MRLITITVAMMVLCCTTSAADIDEYYVVLGSFSSREQANSAASDVGSGFMPQVMRAEDKEVYRLVLGPYSHDVAKQRRDTAQTGSAPDAWLIRTSGKSNAGQPGFRDPNKLNIISASSSPANTVIDSEIHRGISLPSAVQLALSRNNELRAGEQHLLAGKAGVDQIRARRRPRLNATVQQSAIDSDRAEVGFGRSPEFRTTGKVQFSQVIYSDEINAAIKIQQHLQSAEESSQQALILDVILDVSTRYLDLLRAITLAEIHADNLKLTESNYNRSQTRLKLGVANRAEVYRWETAVAGSARELVLANARTEKSRIDLNKALNQELDLIIDPLVPTLQDSYLLIAEPRVWQRLQQEDSKSALRRFWLVEALENSPELKGMRDIREAKRRALSAAHRSITLPRVEIVAEGADHLANSGAGTEQLSFQLPGSETTLGGRADDVEWSAMIRATLPIYQGGERFGRVREEGALLSEANFRYDEALVAVQASILKVSTDVLASLRNIEHSNTAARASRDNLRLVTESFERGILTNIDMLDAQNAMLSSEQAAAHGVYGFLGEYLKLQRILGQFDLASTPEQRHRMVQRMDAFF